MFIQKYVKPYLIVYFNMCSMCHLYFCKGQDLGTDWYRDGSDKEEITTDEGSQGFLRNKPK